jgi:hypothetical protein
MPSALASAGASPSRLPSAFGALSRALLAVSQLDPDFASRARVIFAGSLLSVFHSFGGSLFVTGSLFRTGSGFSVGLLPVSQSSADFTSDFAAESGVPGFGWRLVQAAKATRLKMRTYCIDELPK